MDTYVYKIGDSLYINLTNRCPNACTFCVRNNHDGVEGHYLWLKREPSFDEISALIDGYEDNYDELVFCGFGEPTYRLDAVLSIAKWVKRKNKRVRLNTNGLGSAINNRDISGDLKGLIDIVSVSLNAPDAQSYNKVCGSVYGLSAFDKMLDFCKNCSAQGIETVLSVVDIIGEEKVEESRKLCQDLGLNLRVRKMIS